MIRPFCSELRLDRTTCEAKWVVGLSCSPNARPEKASSKRAVRDRSALIAEERTSEHGGSI
jgi:hypothetical protein